MTRIACPLGENYLPLSRFKNVKNNVKNKDKYMFSSNGRKIQKDIKSKG